MRSTPSREERSACAATRSTPTGKHRPYSGGLLERRAKARGLRCKIIFPAISSPKRFCRGRRAAFIYLAQARKTTGAVIPWTAAMPRPFRARRHLKI